MDLVSSRLTFNRAGLGADRRPIERPWPFSHLRPARHQSMSPMATYFHVGPYWRWSSPNHRLLIALVLVRCWASAIGLLISGLSSGRRSREMQRVVLRSRSTIVVTTFGFDVLQERLCARLRAAHRAGCGRAVIRGPSVASVSNTTLSSFAAAFCGAVHPSLSFFFCRGPRWRTYGIRRFGRNRANREPLSSFPVVRVCGLHLQWVLARRWRFLGRRDRSHPRPAGISHPGVDIRPVSFMAGSSSAGLGNLKVTVAPAVLCAVLEGLISS